MRNKETWDKKVLPKLLTHFTPRIQKVITKIGTGNPPIPIKSTYIYGPAGTGKTILAVQIVLSHLYDLYLNEKDLLFDFITIPELLFEIKETYNGKSQWTEKEILDGYSSVPVLILDDFGVERSTDWSFQILYMIINRRYENDLITIITSNWSTEELVDKLNEDDRIPSRIVEMCILHERNSLNFRSR